MTNMSIKTLLELSNEFIKLASIDTFVLTFIPKDGIKSIKEHGLLSAVKLIF
jgi:hypothetical protein